MTRYRASRAGAVVVLAAIVAPAAAQPCEPDWIEGLFNQPSVVGPVRALQVFDGGDGAALYIAHEGAQDLSARLTRALGERDGLRVAYNRLLRRAASESFSLLA